jgi:hypothetical protein
VGDRQRVEALDLDAVLVAALSAAMMAVSAGSAFAAGKADPPCKGSQAFDCSSFGKAHHF